ncbi:MAG: CBS domain-containing protein [Desulfovibrionaceae bacterium]|nr:CBS domain-containing protein [Desulfovibrionaceae bacterium]
MKVKELMIPVADYQTLGEDASLGDVAAALNASKHRDILVVDKDGSFVGVLTMGDFILALEPNYRKLNKKNLDTDILSNRLVAEQFKEFNLWGDSLSNICSKAVRIKVTDAMHVPEEGHYIDGDSDIQHGVHMYMVGTPQPLIVRGNGNVIGVLRMSDVFAEIVKRMNACALDD